ncbi:hypothetical protein CARUB_v10022356mg [Capsella rubella]|uniref:Methyltransferase type 11 domain-containing protein n=1 Tax=Capsella rubella TaxID=81985 RepID=R0GFZ8_9BRAS|nr:hypothetical protein CARUB_v10022356mg [Capsella rubella]
MAILYFSSSTPFFSTIIYSPRRKIRALRDSSKTHKNLITTDHVSSFRSCPCGRRHFLGAVPFLPISPSYASGSSASTSTISDYKIKLFDNLVGKAEKVLEIGIGTGPNIKYYTAIPNVSVIGVDPNAKMESYARKSAAEAGIKSEDFTFIHAIKRILRPGGIYLFIEHVAAEDGTFLRLVQNVLDPLQQVVADGCHLTRHTGKSILEAKFNGGSDVKKASISSIAYISSHVYGIAYS